MVFSSPIFLFGFLPILIVGSILFGGAWRNRFLFAGSLVFYAWGEPVFVLLLIVSILTNFLVAKMMARPSSRRFLLLCLGVGLNLALLATFKYAPYVMESSSELMGFLGVSKSGSELDLSSWPEMPIGISFFTFQSISYLVDVYRNIVRYQRSLINLGLYISMFPQLIAGPIVRYCEIEEQLENRKRSLNDCNEGALRFIRGLAKKVLIADTLAVYADAAFAAPTDSLTAFGAWFGLGCYSLQIYYDFSGYSDMAIGLGRMLGFRFPENFDFPYAARNLRDFWKRWHMTLSRWFRDYLYIPLGGNRGSRWAVSRNLIVVFLLCGLWHGANWTFLFWGVFHGVFLSIERTGFGHFMDRLPRALQHIYLVLAVMMGWVLFRCENLVDALDYYSVMLSIKGQTANTVISIPIGRDTLLAFFIAIGFSTKIPLNLGRQIVGRLPRFRRVVEIKYVGALALLALCMIAIASNTYSPFLYFRF